MSDLLTRVEALEGALGEVRAAKQAAERRGRRWRWIALAWAALAVLLVPMNGGWAGAAQGVGDRLDTLMRRVAGLEGRVNAVDNRLDQQQAQINKTVTDTTAALAKVAADQTAAREALATNLGNAIKQVATNSNTAVEQDRQRLAQIEEAMNAATEPRGRRR